VRAHRPRHGDDYPRWNPQSALKVFNELKLSGQQQKTFRENALRVFGLKNPALARATASL
jgi:predicted TIM-barrel fold metal-dependent hydrolase